MNNFTKAVDALYRSVSSIIDDAGLDEIGKLEAVEETFKQYHQYTETVLKADPQDEDDADEDDGDAAMAETESDASFSDMTPDEQKTVETRQRHERAHRQRRRLQKEDSQMDVIQIAKNILAGMPTMYTKKDFYDAINARAQAARCDGQTEAQAFAKYIETADGALLYRASKIAAQDAAEPAASTVTSPTPEATPSYKRLVAKAEVLRKADGKLSEAQAFAKVYEDPANRPLVAAEKRERVEKYAATEHVGEMRKREAGRAA